MTIPVPGLQLQRWIFTGTTARSAPVPHADFEFVRWKADATGGSSPLTFELVRDFVVEAAFVEMDAPTALAPNDAFADAEAVLGDTGSLDAGNVGAGKGADRRSTPAGPVVHPSGGFAAEQDGALTLVTIGSAIGTVLDVYTRWTLGGLSQGAMDDGG